MNEPNLSDLYKLRFTTEELPRKNAIWAEICQHFLQSHIEKDCTLVDIACGYGEFTNNIQAGRKIAIDLNPDAQKFLQASTEFHLKPANSISSIIENGADIVFTSNFLEHLPNKAALDDLNSEVYKALKPGGKYLILGPNLRYLPGEYWDFYDHHLGLTHLSLMEALQLKGFTIETCIPKFLPYTTQGALPTHPSLVKLYLKFPLIWRVLGKQFFLVARKPA